MVKKLNAFQKQLKKFGMTEEFKEWMQKESARPREFQIGDKVRMISGNYCFTTPGSEGTILQTKGDYTSDKYLDIEWYKLTGDCRQVPCRYDVHREHVEFI